MKTPIYLDYAATTPVDPQVAEAMAHCLTQEGNFGNPASRSHVYGWQAEAAVENARRQVADLIHADPREIVWTSGATEANNLALKGALEYQQEPGKTTHIVTCTTEHKAVLDVLSYLEQRGVRITYLTPAADGRVSVAQVQEALCSDTVLVSLMHANNELGALHPIAEVGHICRQRNILFHVDAAQSTGKLPINVAELKVDLLSLSAHKFYGPKGIGALYVRRHPDVKVMAQIHGGGHERHMRSGTLATHQIVGIGQAAQLASDTLELEHQRINALRQQFIAGVKHLEGVILNGSETHCVSGIANFSFTGVTGESLLTALRDLAVSTGSACTSANLEPSYVLKAIGLSSSLADSAIRFSFGRFTTEEEVNYAINTLVNTVPKLRAQNAQSTSRLNAMGIK